MARRTRTIYTGGRNKEIFSKFQRLTTEEGRNLQRSKRREYENEDQENTSSFPG